MHILAIDQYGELAGAQRCLLDAVAGFAAAGWETHAAVAPGPLAVELRRYCQSVATLPCGPFDSGSKSARDALRFAAQSFGQTATIRRLIAQRAVDALYVNGPRLMPAAAVAARRRTPVIFHAHSRVTQPAALRLLRSALRWSGARVIAS